MYKNKLKLLCIFFRESWAGQECIGSDLETCNSKFTQTEENDTILHQHFSPPKTYICGPGQDKASQTSPCLTIQCSMNAPRILGFSPRSYSESHVDTGRGQMVLMNSCFELILGNRDKVQRFSVRKQVLLKFRMCIKVIFITDGCGPRRRRHQSTK